MVNSYGFAKNSVVSTCTSFEGSPHTMPKFTGITQLTKFTWWTHSGVTLVREPMTCISCMRASHTAAKFTWITQLTKLTKFTWWTSSSVTLVRVPMICILYEGLSHNCKFHMNNTVHIVNSNLFYLCNWNHQQAWTSSYMSRLESTLSFQIDNMFITSINCHLHYLLQQL